jgi:BirA family biotin operon repressor/biotin-[acetyl-CoA-carboxylase] ligase
MKEHQPKATSDTLFPREFKKRESKIHYFPEVDSTMEIARNMAKDQCPHFTVIIADRQTKGRGRLKRTWISEEGGLYFTIILKPDLPISQVHILNFGASLSLAKILQDHFALNAKVKWPNDVLVDGKKISGLLSEMEANEDGLAFVNIGIGINVNNNPTIEEPNATSIKKLLGENSLRKTILSLFLDEFESLLIHSSADKIMNQWKKYTMTLGREVQIVTSRETVQGTAMDVDENGALILKLKDGKIKKIIYGDCFVS